MIATLSLALALLAASQNDDEALQCDDPRNQHEMNACARRDFERADVELNAAWREALASARAADADINREFDQRPTSEAKLREAQRAWLVFRDAHCTVLGYEEARGGSMESMVYEGCRARLTGERSAELRSLPIDE